MPAKATAIFEGDDSKLQDTVKRIDRTLLSIQGKFAGALNFGKAALQTAGLVAAYEAVKTGIQGALSAGQEYYRQSQQTGVAAGEIFTIGKHFRAAGIEADAAVPAIQRMLFSLQKGTARETISRLGLDLEKLRKQTPAQEFAALGKAINALPSIGEKVAAARDIFGKGGDSLVAVFGTKGFGDDKIKGQAEILNRDAALFNDVSIKLQRAGINVSSFFFGVADKVAGVISPLLDRMQKVDLSSWGQQLGDIMATVIQSFSDGSLGDIVLTDLEISFGEAINYLYRLLNGTFEAFTTGFSESIKVGLTLLEIVTRPEFWKGLGFALLSAAEAFTAMMLHGIAEVEKGVSSIPGLGALRSVGNTHEQWSRQLDGAAAAHAAPAASMLTPVLEEIGKRVGQSSINTAKAFGRGFANAGDVFDTGDLQNHLAGALTKEVAKTTAQQQKALKENPSTTGLPALGPEEGKMSTQGISALQRIGGAFGGFSAGQDPLVAHAQKQTSLLQQIRDRLPADPTPKKEAAPARYP